MLQLTLPNLRDGTHPLTTNTLTGIHKSSNNWTQTTSQFFTSRSTHSLQVTRIKLTTQQLFTWLFKKKTKLHIQSMQITLQASRDIRLVPILASSCLSRSMEITSFTCMLMIQDPLTHSKRNLEHSRSTSMKDQLMPDTLQWEMTTNFLTKSPTTSHQKKPKRDRSFQSFSL